MKKPVCAVIIAGVSSIISQIILLREFLIPFYGNVLSAGIILAVWFLWTAAGSRAGAYLSKKIQYPRSLLAFLQTIYSFFLLAAVLAVRGLRMFIGAPPGEILGIVPMCIYSLFLLSGVCIINGIIFVSGCAAFSGRDPAGKAYILESAGAGTGGILCSLILLRFFNTMDIICFLIILNLLSASFIGTKTMRTAALTGAGIILALYICGFIDILNISSRKMQWKGYEVTASEDSPYGNITVTRYASTYNFYENGLLSFSIPDTFSAEDACHLAVLQHPAPERVLVIGGGAGGVLKECLKYKRIKTIDYAELDPLMISLSQKVPGSGALKDPRVRIFNIDGRRFLKKTTVLYDIILLNLPDPHTAQINRFYTSDFFKIVSEHLTRYGIFSASVTSSENYISPELGDYIRCIYYTMKEVFPDVKAVPGNRCRFIAARKSGYITDDYSVMEKRLPVAAKYTRSYYLKYRMSPERMDILYKELNRKGPVFINRDFHPICYYYNIIFWSTYFNDVFKYIFKAVSGISIWHFTVLIAAAFILRGNKKNSYVLFPVFLSGFSEMGFQIITILGFQILYGYIYYKFGIIFGSFMCGLAAGSLYAHRALSRLKKPFSLFLKTQAGITLYSLFLPIIFCVLTKIPRISFAGENFILPYLPAAPGFIAGIQFPLANYIYMKKGYKTAGRSAGITYAADIAGACAGVFIISAFILPLLGLIQTCIIISMLNLCGLIRILKHQPASSL